MFLPQGIYEPGRGHGDGDLRVGLIEAAHLLKVGVEALEKASLIGGEGHAVAVGLVSRTMRREFSKSRSWMRRPLPEEAGDEMRCAVQMGEDPRALIVAEVGLDIGASFGAEGVHIAGGCRGLPDRGTKGQKGQGPG